ncbi:protein of unknown function [Devosia enhydra]|uniref:DUF305 domain-containing protein n=1 Tax=Devosia enhydra TaxID=665118 RepID=A0A1K2I051_9HYPH|nr:DUF305 domain-containing protein [Devosia enhydra]SFZ85655.1 protein of unknown function [Devosia enhydra]
MSRSPTPLRGFMAALALLGASALPLPALAQHAHHGAAPAEAATTTLPDICLEHASMEGHDMSGDAMAGSMEDAQAPSPAHQAMIDDMMAMHDEMMVGMMAEDFDVAFVCGMIPHHQGAIAMAEAVLEHGNDAWTKGLARKIIAAQQQEITDMLNWLKQQESEHNH